MCVCSPGARSSELKPFEAFSSHHPSVSMLFQPISLSQVEQVFFRDCYDSGSNFSLTYPLIPCVAATCLQPRSSFVSVRLDVSLQQITHLGSSSGSQDLLRDRESVELLPLHQNRWAWRVKVRGSQVLKTGKSDISISISPPPQNEIFGY